MRFWLLRLLDGLGHRLHVPYSVLRPICDAYDIALGVPDTPANFPERWREEAEEA